jgi:hypothetical protein
MTWRAFTTGDSGDLAVHEGVILPLAGIDNLPYRILFTLDQGTPALLEPGSRLKHRRSGHVLRVENRALMLFTWRVLQHFTNKTLGDLLARYQEPGRPIIELDNGLYEVEVLAGALVRDGLYEPAFEFVLKKTYSHAGNAEVDTGYRYSLRGLRLKSRVNPLLQRRGLPGETRPSGVSDIPVLGFRQEEDAQHRRHHRNHDRVPEP